MLMTEKKGLRIRNYDSVQETIELAKQPSQANKHIWRNTEQSPSNDKYQWVGVSGGINKIRELISLGWEDGASKLERRAENLKGENAPAPINMRRRRKWGEQGDTLDITRTYAGITEAWQRCERVSTNSTRYIEIICNLSINSQINADVIFWRGAAALILADLMTGAGYNVKITGCVSATNMFKVKDMFCVDFFTVKDYQQPLDINSLASVVCMAGFFRTVWFQLATTHEEAIEESLGRSITLERAYGKLDAHQIGGVEGIRDELGAKQWVEESIKHIQGQELLAA